ncbi:MAG: hypothetical protein M1564_03255 [Candidatus Marsarchaeota archaeon]|jgi:4-hydroxybenzoate polyprenyltransferase|nr:hypothetical protein [Candidatus Marsarchaeota archaeon]MCL5431289.1 hypothetical protein [Candidatus Marsarchaeota archaeon]
MAKVQTELLSSLFTVVFSITAIIIFIYHGGSIMFYVVAAFALAAGLFNAWILSKSGEEGTAARNQASVPGPYVNVAAKRATKHRAKRRPRKSTKKRR